MSKAIIDFEKGDISALKEISDKLQAIIDKEGAVGEAWKQTSADMNAQSKTNVDTTNKLAQSIDQMAVASKSLDKVVIGGAYKNYLTQIQQTLGLTSKELVAYIQNARKAAQEAIFSSKDDQQVKELTVSIEVMNEQLKQMGVTEDGTSAKTVSLRTQLRNVRDELAAMAQAGLAGTPAFEALKQKAGSLDNEMKDLNETISNIGSDTRNIDGVISIATGLAGAFSIAQGTAALFGSENEDVAKALLKVQAAMAILNGLQEVGNILQSKSSANILLNSLFRKANTAATVEGTVAQKGLNAAMLANPVGIVLAGLVALFGAYELYINTIGKASNAEAQRKSSIEALKEAQDKAAENVGKEEGELNQYIATAKNELLTREERQTALDEAKAKFPGYLANIDLENIATEKSTELISKQIELIKQKALTQAAGDVYQEKLKEQIKAQNELNDVIQNGISFGQILQASLTAPGSNAVSATIISKQQAVVDATNAANGAFDSQNKIIQDLGKIYESDADKLKDYIKELDDIIAHSSGLVQAFAKVAEAGAKAKLPTASTVKPFDPKAFEQERKNLTENAQYRIDISKKGSEAELSARMALNEIENQEEIKRINQTAGNDETAKHLLLIQHGKYLATKNQLNEEARQKDYANSLSFMEAEIDRQKIALLNNETDQISSINKITELEIEAIKKRRDAALASASNPGERDKINADANLAVLQAEKKSQADILNIQKQGIENSIAASRAGSFEEYTYKLSLIDIEQQKELQAAGLTEKAKNDIIAKYRKLSIEADIAYQQIQLDNAISRDNAELNHFGITEQQKLKLTLERINDEENKEIIGAEKNNSKIAEIRAKYDTERLQAEQATIDAQLAIDLKALDVYGQKAKSINDSILKNAVAPEGAKLIANNEIQLAEQAKIDAERKALQDKLDQNLITYNDYYIKIKELKNQEDVINQTHADNAVKIFKDELDKKLALLQNSITIIQAGVDTMDTGGLKTGLTSVLGLFSQIGAAINSNAAAQKAADQENDPTKKAALQAAADQQKLDNTQKTISAGIMATQATLNQVFSDASAQRQQQMADDLQALEDQKNKELANTNLSAKQKEEINARYAAKEKQVRLQEWKAEQEAKKEQAIINGALAITNIIATVPKFDFGISTGIMIAAAVAATALQVAAIGKVKPPKFRHGQIDIQGPGTSTSDSIPSLLSRGESVIKAESTAKWKDALIAINNDHFEDYLGQKFKSFVFPHIPENTPIPTGNPKEIDYDRLAVAVAKEMKGIIPEPTHVKNIMTVDENGIRKFFEKGNARTEWKNKRFSMD